MEKETYVATSRDIEPYTFRMYRVPYGMEGKVILAPDDIIFTGDWSLGASLFAAGILVAEQDSDNTVLFLLHPDNAPTEDEE